MLLVGSVAPERYEMLMQEDRFVEWGTVWLFLAAGLIGLRDSIRQRRIFDGLVALFCLFIAGEEFSWGQRLLGFYSPEYFLANNLQQEVNIHNLPGSFLRAGSPRGCDRVSIIPNIQAARTVTRSLPLPVLTSFKPSVINLSFVIKHDFPISLVRVENLS
jgi:hypothetical protein